ncbi:MAG: 2-amino-4-hydroxy-6-hydroxymethyldihydropteridine diphosphokinase [Rickettsiales bacterium]|nr:2-amino-4-hydroxy-6-hydroxymethyldihydropteridine diphosphokinase [Rickettsiales bacterium]
MKIALSLGSNKGDRNKNLFLAIRELLDRKLVSNIVCSTLFENKALLLPGAPVDWDMDYINCAVVGETHLNPEELLKNIKDIEGFLGRKSIVKWSPREIDIDILYYDTLQVQSESLVIPHVEMLERNFVMLPLKEVMPQWKYNGKGKYCGYTIEEIVREKYGA